MKNRICLLTAVCLLLFSANLLAQQEMKVLSYNVLKGLQQDSTIQREYIHWVDSLAPDIVAYEEMNGFTQKSLEDFAAKYGHPYAIQSKIEGFPVALSSKYPIVNVQKVVDNMWHAYLYANINHIHVFVIHFSPFSYKKRQQEVQQVLAHAATLPKDEKIMIMGDFNSMASSDAAQLTEAMLQGMRENERKHDHIRNLNNGQVDYSVTDAMKDAGFFDSYWLKNKTFMPSIPTKKYGQPARRIDFLWVNKSLAKQVKSSTIIHDKSTDHLSDHYPVFVVLDL